MSTPKMHEFSVKSKAWFLVVWQKWEGIIGLERDTFTAIIVNHGITSHTNAYLFIQ